MPRAGLTPRTASAYTSAPARSSGAGAFRRPWRLVARRRVRGCPAGLRRARVNLPGSCRRRRRQRVGLRLGGGAVLLPHRQPDLLAVDRDAAGAAIPSRTVWPLTPMTVTRISSPMTTRSPGRRVRISIEADYEAIRLAPACSRGGGVERRRRLLGSANSGACSGRSGVDHLVAAAVADHQRRAQVGGDVERVRGRAHGHVQRRSGGVLDAGALAILGARSRA